VLEERRCNFNGVALFGTKVETTGIDLILNSRTLSVVDKLSGEVGLELILNASDKLGVYDFMTKTSCVPIDSFSSSCEYIEGEKIQLIKAPIKAILVFIFFLCD
jgi:hypothetical protein